MNPAMQRKLVQHPIGVFIALLLALLLALGGYPCPMPTPANSAPLPSAHGCCPDQIVAPERPAAADFFQQKCAGNSCLQSVTHHSATDRHGLPASAPDGSSQPLAAAWPLSPAWKNNGQIPPSLSVAIIGPSPPQRSRILRL